MLRIASIALALSALAIAQDAGVDVFEKKIRPVLATRCYACHSSSMTSPQAGLRLDSAQAIRQGGNSGVIIQSGEPERSLLLRALRYTDKTLKMPPGKPLAPEVVADFEAWVRAGASMPVDQPKPDTKTAALWSLQRPQPPSIPDVRDKARIRNDIDAFIARQLDDKGLTPAPEADKRTLIRRATYDLTGLPPTIDEVEKFVRDNSPQAYERLVDRLLASPRYGERWGRHWLDVARYADSVNDSVNAAQRYAWSYTYRDWVVRAFNEDLPYDRFLQFQLAADRIPNADPKNLAALGFLSLGREFPNSFPETVDDRIDAVTRGMMGFTVACARCHDHKYDPIPTKDYYSLYSILSNIR
jgi:cytochrome c553